MTLHAPEGLPIILMERFEGLTSAVDCKGDDGHMSLTFSSKKAYQYALKIWGKINEDDAKQFLLIANHDGCGPADERQPYKYVVNLRRRLAFSWLLTFNLECRASRTTQRISPSA